MDSKVDISKACSGASSLPLPFAKSTSTPRGQALVQVHKVLLRSVLLVLGLFALRYLSPYLQLPGSSSRTINGVQWKSCGDNFQCANVSVPLDHHNASDARMVSIAVVRLLAADKENRQGAVFLNPGGPGGSGTDFVYRRGPQLSKILKGQFDLVGFDPRGVNMTQPRVSCFASRLEEDAFSTMMNGLGLNLPANLTTFEPYVEQDMQRQVAYKGAVFASLAQKCKERTDDAMAFMGTEAVVRDVNVLSKTIEGEDKRINFWGFSYGTIIGQYLIKILPPSRIGRVIIDGVVDPVVWASHASEAFEEGLDNVDDVLSSFASSCLAAGANCTLNSGAHKFASAGELLAKIDQTLDELYVKPVPVFDLDVPAVATANNLREVLFSAMYGIKNWPVLAEHLQAAFSGNFSGIMNATMPRVNPAHVGQPDSTTPSTLPIFCADTKPYSDRHPPPTDMELTGLVMNSMRKYSFRMGDRFFYLALCHHWDAAGVAPRRSHYSGPFDMVDGTLDTPILVLSNTYDPVTSLASAKRANERLGDNARLIQQKDGWGHCTINHASFCTARAARRYMVDGTPPTENHGLCSVDQVPWQPFESDAFTSYGGINGDELDEERELEEAWATLAKEWEWKRSV